MPAYQIQVRGLLDGVTPFVIPDPIPAPANGGVIKIDAGAGIDVGTFDVGALVGTDVPVWVRGYHIELASGTRASRSLYSIPGSRQDQLLAPVNSVPGGTLFMRPYALNPNAIAPVGTTLIALTDDAGAAFGGSPVTGPHFVYMDLVPIVTDEQMTMIQQLEAFADTKARAEGEIYESFQGAAATLTVDVGLYVSPLGEDMSFNAQTGMLQGARVSIGTAPAAGESMVVAIERVFGVAGAVTMATITIDNSFSNGDVVDIPLTNNNVNLLSDNRIRIARTYVAGMAPQPMADTTVRAEIVPVRDPNR